MAPARRQQQTLWPGVLELSTDFYETLAQHAVPLDYRALSALKHSALALDVYTWLAHRLCRIRQAGGVMLSWENLRDQFGQEYVNAKDFKREFRDVLRQVWLVYPDARIEDAPGGIILRESPPPISKATLSMPGLRTRRRSLWISRELDEVIHAESPPPCAESPPGIG